MTGKCFSFADFELDPAERQLRRGGAAVEVNGRYLDALTLLVREAGRLVTKDRFMDEVWRGVPVTDEALTQCIKSLRRELGDDAARPRFIETVPRHGYRFIAPVTGRDHAPLSPTTPSAAGRLRLALAGVVGAGLAGLAGGVFYGFVGSAQPGGAGGASLVVVLAVICLAVALLAGMGVTAGIALLATPGGRPTARGIVGGALGGLAVGGLVKLIGLDAFNLLIGRAPSGIAGPFEGVLLGAAVGAAAWLAFRDERSAMRAVATAAGIGAAAGLLVTLAGGRLMAGSLDLLAREFPGSRLRLDSFARLLGEAEFGRLSSVATGTLEGALFACGVVGAMVAARNRFRAAA